MFQKGKVEGGVCLPIIGKRYARWGNSRGADSDGKVVVIKVIAKSGEVLLFDEPYYSVAKKYNWRSNTVNGKKYYSAYAGGKSQSLSKLVFDIKPNHIVYHKNGISEDFSNNNIIVCSRHDVWKITDKKPGRTSRYYYVTWYKSHNKWGVEQERNSGIRQRWMFHEEIEAALWADYRNAVLLQNDRKRNFPELTNEQLEDKIADLNIKYGRSNKERQSKTRQGNSFCRKKRRHILVCRSREINMWLKYATTRNK